jgi:hypothetical protein
MNAKNNSSLLKLSKTGHYSFFLRRDIMQNTPAKGKDIDQASGTNPAFLIKVVYAENFSIQGYIRWIEEGKSVPFRSYMEMLHLIQEGLYHSRKETGRLRSWDIVKEDAKDGKGRSGVL